MDGENNGKPYEQMDDLGVFPYFWKHPYLSVVKSSVVFFVIFPCMSLFQFWDVWGIPASLEGYFCAFGACLSSGWNFMTLVPLYSLLNVSEFPAPYK